MGLVTLYFKAQSKVFLASVFSGALQIWLSFLNAFGRFINVLGALAAWIFYIKQRMHVYYCVSNKCCFRAILCGTIIHYWRKCGRSSR